MTAVSFVRDTHYCFSAGKDKMVKYWDLDRSGGEDTRGTPVLWFRSPCGGIKWFVIHGFLIVPPALAAILLVY